MMRGAILPLLLLTLFGPGCVDLCVLSGRPCDGPGDCSDGEVCRLRRSFELFCVFAAGTCEPGECGSVADCNVDECCHPDSNRCVDSVAYSADRDFASRCDTRTCLSCPECLFGSCDPAPQCTKDAECPDDQRCEDDKCRDICTEDHECPLAYCSGSDTCTEPVGTPCRPGYDGYTDCGGAQCLDVDASNTRVDGYCTRSCYDWDSCPGEYLCVDYDCRVP